MEPFYPRTRFVPTSPAGTTRSCAHSSLRRPRAWTVVALGLLSGCQSYERKPLDSAAHHAEWRERTLTTASLEEFLAQLDERSTESVEFDPADGLSVREGQLVALVYNPTLRTARLRSKRAVASAAEAGRWDDPRFEFAALHITDDVPDPWVITPGLTFTVPLSGRLGAERSLADAERLAANGAAMEAEWRVWRDVRAAWIEWSAALTRAEETERFVEDMQDLVRTANGLAERGEILRTEASLLLVEESQRRNQARRLRGEAEAREQQLRTLMGISPTTPLQLLPSLDATPECDGGDPGEALFEDLERRNPSLTRLRHEYDAAEEALRLEIRRQYPDLTIGPLYESDAGQSRIGFLGGIPIPLWNANRRAIAEARADRELSRAAVETTLQMLVGRWAAAEARADSLAGQREELVGVLIPLVDQQVEDAMALMELGESDSALVLLASLTRAFETKLDLIDTKESEALARTELAFLLGPDPTPEEHQSPSEAAEDKR